MISIQKKDFNNNIIWVFFYWPISLFPQISWQLWIGWEHFSKLSPKSCGRFILTNTSVMILMVIVSYVIAVFTSGLVAGIGYKFPIIFQGLWLFLIVIVISVIGFRVLYNSNENFRKLTKLSNGISLPFLISNVLNFSSLFSLASIQRREFHFLSLLAQQFAITFLKLAWQTFPKRSLVAILMFVAELFNEINLLFFFPYLDWYVFLFLSILKFLSNVWYLFAISDSWILIHNTLCYCFPSIQIKTQFQNKQAITLGASLLAQFFAPFCTISIMASMYFGPNSQFFLLEPAFEGKLLLIFQFAAIFLSITLVQAPFLLFLFSRNDLHPIQWTLTNFDVSHKWFCFCFWNCSCGTYAFLCSFYFYATF